MKLFFKSIAAAMMSFLAQPFSPHTSSCPVCGPNEGMGPPPLNLHNFMPVIASTDRPFVCNESGCGRRFNRKYTLTEHKKTHTGEKPFVCPLLECSRRFSTSGNLARHKRMHASLKPFECDIYGCKRSFSSQDKLDHHFKIHTGRKIHMCRVTGCAKTFSTAGNLTRHIKSRHPGLSWSSYYSYPDAWMTYAQKEFRPAVHKASPKFFAEPLTKIESMPSMFSRGSANISSFHKEMSAFHMAYTFITQSSQDIARHPINAEFESAVSDVTCCSMSLLDEVIEFELAKTI